MSVTEVEPKPNSKFDGSGSSYSTSSRISVEYQDIRLEVESNIGPLFDLLFDPK